MTCAVRDSGIFTRMAYNWGNPANPKFYYGTKHESPWNQELHRRAMNESESAFLLSIQAGRHKSQHVLKEKALLLSARGSDCSTARTAASDTSGFDETMNGLSGMNHVLKTQLSELKSYLSETNKRLEFLETGTLPSNRSSFRSHRTQTPLSGRSRPASVISGAREAIKKTQRLTARSRSSAGYNL